MTQSLKNRKNLIQFYQFWTILIAFDWFTDLGNPLACCSVSLRSLTWASGLRDGGKFDVNGNIFVKTCFSVILNQKQDVFVKHCASVVVICGNRVKVTVGSSLRLSEVA